MKLRRVKANIQNVRKIIYEFFYKDVFNLKILKSEKKDKPVLSNRNIFIFDYITKNKPVYNILKSYFESHDVNVLKEYIESLISNNNINTIRRTLRNNMDHYNYVVIWLVILHMKLNYYVQRSVILKV